MSQSIRDFDYDDKTATDSDEVVTEEWYAEMAEELQNPGSICYASDRALENASKKDIEEAAVNEAYKHVQMAKHGIRIDEDRAAIMTFPDHTAIVFMREGKRITIRLTPGDTVMVTAATLFSGKGLN